MILNDTTGIQNLEITVDSTPAPIAWNMAAALQWAKDYAKNWEGVAVTDENLPIMQDVEADLKRKEKRLDEIRLEQKRAYLVPLDRFEAEIKQVIAAIVAVRLPISNQTKVYVEKRRDAKRQEAINLIQEALQSSDLRKNFADQVTVDESWTNLGATKSKVKAEIQAKIDKLIQAQAAEDALLEARRQRQELIDQTLAQTTEAFSLSVPLSARAVVIPETASLAEISTIIMTAASKQKQAEEAAVKRAEDARQKAEQDAANRKQQEEADKAKQADIAAAQEAIRQVEAAQQKPDETPVPVKEKAYKGTFAVYGTLEQLMTFEDILRNNGWNYVNLSVEE